MLGKVRYIVNGFIDFFHRLMFRWIPIQTFRYLACGGSNTLLNIALFHITYFHILQKNNLHLFGNVTIDVNVMAWIAAFSITFPVGFILSRHVVFPESNLHGKVQLFRYAIVTIIFIILNYILIKLFEEYMPFVHPTIRIVFVGVIIAALSFVSQRIYTFKTVEKEEDVLVVD